MLIIYINGLWNIVEKTSMRLRTKNPKGSNEIIMAFEYLKLACDYNNNICLHNGEKYITYIIRLLSHF